MDKSDVVRRLQAIEKLSGLRAAPPGTAQEALPLSKAQLMDKLPKRTESDDVQSLEDAGWTFQSTENAPGDAFEVVLDSDGHIKLASPSLTVRFAPEMSGEEISATLREFGLTVRRELKFSENTFVLDAVASGIDAARILNMRDDVVYAEPNLIEPIKKR
jgi:hypothetical protein